MPTIAERIAHLCPEVQKVRRIEYAILRRICLDALKAGYTLGLYDGEEIVLEGATTAKQVIDAACSTDDDRILVYKDGKRIGWIWLVYGNSGWDLVTDYTCNLEHIMAGATALADKYCQ